MRRNVRDACRLSQRRGTGPTLILLPEGIVDPSFFEETDSALLCRSPERSPKGTPKGRSLIFLTPVNTSPTLPDVHSSAVTSDLASHPKLARHRQSGGSALKILRSNSHSLDHSTGARARRMMPTQPQKFQTGPSPSVPRSDFSRSIISRRNPQPGSCRADTFDRCP